MSDNDLEALRNLAKTINAKTAAEAAKSADVARMALQDRQRASERWAALYDMIQSEISRINSLSNEIAAELNIEKLNDGSYTFGRYVVRARSLRKNSEVSVSFYLNNDYGLMIKEQDTQRQFTGSSREEGKFSKGNVEEIRATLNLITQRVMNS